MRKNIVLLALIFSFFAVSCASPTASATPAPIKPTAIPCRGSMPLAAQKFAKTSGEPVVSIPILSSNELGVGFFVETVSGKVFFATARHVVPQKDDCGILFNVPGQKTLYSVSVDNFKQWSGISDAFITYELPPETAKEVLRFAKSGELRIFTVTNAPSAGETVFLPVVNTGKYTVLRVSNARRPGDDRIIADLFGTSCQGESGTPIIDITKTSVVGVLSAIEMKSPYFTRKDERDCSSRIYFTPAIPTP